MKKLKEVSIGTCETTSEFRLDKERIFGGTGMEIAKLLVRVYNKEHSFG